MKYPITPLSFLAVVLISDGASSPVFRFTYYPEFMSLVYIVFYHNGYGASITKNEYSLGYDRDLWEVAVLKGNKDNYEYCFDTPIADRCAVGNLDNSDVIDICRRIRALE